MNPPPPLSLKAPMPKYGMNAQSIHIISCVFICKLYLGFGDTSLRRLISSTLHHEYSRGELSATYREHLYVGNR